jgi:hypothetical protein
MLVRCPFCDETGPAQANPVNGLFICSSCGQVLPAGTQTMKDPAAAGPPTVSPPASRPQPRSAVNPPLPPGKAQPTAVQPRGKGQPTGIQPVPAPPSLAKSGPVPVVGAAGAPGRKTKAPSQAGQGPKQPTGASLPLLEAMVQPVVAGGRRWVTLVCVALSVCILAGSAVLAARQRRKPDAPQPARAVAAAPREAPAPASAVRQAPEPERTSAAPAGTPETLHGGIEIGSKGIKAVVVRVRPPGAGGPSFELAAPPLTANPTLVAGLKETGMFAPDVLRDAARVVATFCERLGNDHKVPPERIFVVASSGLLETIKERSDLLETNRKHLAEAIRTAAGKEVVFIDVARELELTFRGTVPAEHLDDSLLIDVGSGSTKATCSEGGAARLIPVSIACGTVSFAEEVDRRVREDGGTFAGQIARVLKDNEKIERLREAIRRSPALANQKRIYLVGGLVWALATWQHPGDRGDFVPLSAADLEAFVAKLEKAPAGPLPDPDLTSVADDKTREEAQKDIKGVRKNFNRDQLLAGARLLQALLVEFGAGADRELLFARQGYLGLVMGSALHAKDRQR